jgi:hypothetical protein
MSERVGDAEQKQSSKVQESLYYKKLQASLQQQRADHRKQLIEEQNTERLTTQKQQKENTAKEKIQDVTAKAAATLDMKDEVVLSSFSWAKDNKKQSKLKKSQKTQSKADAQEIVKASQETKAVEADGLKILRVLGIKINMTSKVSELKESLLRNTVQARSHNFFLAKFAQFKVGIIGQLLSVLGVSQEELQKLQKKALGAAVDENMRLMGENVYNLELTELVYGKSKKVRRSLAMYAEIQTQLMLQMKALGRPGYWTKVRLLEERIMQCKKIKQEFVLERNNLVYQYEYYSATLGVIENGS